MTTGIPDTPCIHPLYKAGDVAAILKVSRSFAYRLMQKGSLPTVKIGKTRRVRAEDLLAYIEASRHGDPLDELFKEG